MANRYDVGDLVRVSASFTDENGNAVDPTTVVVKYRAGGADIVTYTYPTDAEVVKDSTGNYHIDIEPSVSNTRYSYKFDGTGTLIASAEGYFYTNISRF